MNRDLAPVALATIAAAIWGVWWIPIRYLESLGLHGAWAGMAMNAGAFATALFWLMASRTRLWLPVRGLIGAALVGVAVSTYSTALTYTDVVRAVLLFYLAPVWSKIIEWAFLKMPWRWTTTLALIAALVGAYFVLDGQVSLDAMNLGDVLALMSGLAWAAGAALIFSGGPVGAFSLTTVTAGCAVLMALPFALASGWPGLGDGLALALPTGMMGGAIYVLPIMVLTLWSAQRLAPTLITFLLTAEILSGVISGALLLDEPFGMMQVWGTVLIVFAALSEVLTGMRRLVADSD